jgi:peptidyl-prolyl cis-trans isomerase SurA
MSASLLPYRRLALAAALALSVPMAGPALSAPPAAPAASAPAASAPVGPSTDIVATVDGDVISNADVASRTRFFALSTGTALTPDVMNRLHPQITRQLIDERLRLQEIQRRRIVVSDKQIADAIHEIEQRNNMAPGTLRKRLIADGAGMRTLIDQIRVQLGWTQVLRQQLGERTQVIDQDIDDRMRTQQQQQGKPEYHLFEIFIPVDDPSHAAEAERFANIVIAQLRAGASFQVTAAQFSQSQTALQGGDVGWVQENQIDPEVLRVAQQMPVGAVSNPVKVPGGFSIVALAGRREIGRDPATMVSLRQMFLPFATPLIADAPTEQQRQILEKARSIGAGIHSCDAMEEAAKANNSTRPTNPGDLRLERMTPPAFRQLLATLPFDRTSQPIISNDGIAIVIVCSREQKDMATLSKDDVRGQLISERVELLSRQVQRDLRRRAHINERGAGGV